jgi:hypothetical protein
VFGRIDICHLSNNPSAVITQALMDILIGYSSVLAADVHGSPHSQPIS